MKTETKLRCLYIANDVIATLLGVLLFSVIRYYAVPGITDRVESLGDFLLMPGVIATYLLYPPFMLLVYYLTGYYMSVENKSRVKELIMTFNAVAIGALAFFLVVLLNDLLPRRRYNYELILLFASTLFIVVYSSRLILTTLIKRHQARRAPNRNYLLVTGANDPEADREDMAGIARSFGFTLSHVLTPAQCLDIEFIAFVKEHNIRGIVFRPEEMTEKDFLSLLNRFFKLDIPVLLSPDDRAIVTGNVRFDSVTVEPLVDITRISMSDSVLAIKRFSDVIVSAIGLLIASPVMLWLAIRIKMQSPGPVFYSQERIGYRRRPFKLHKLRSMIVDSEPDGPRLSTDNDPRITPIGRTMRKYRLDELPNLWNVLKGDMSLVGPRPERDFFIRQIIPLAPHYALLHIIRPGLTSWGMVKYGYASTVPQMAQRLRYDLLYLSNISLSVDLRILLHTVTTVTNGEGK